MGYYGYNSGYGVPYGGSGYPAYNVGYRPAWGMGYVPGYAMSGATCCPSVCCDPCGGACSGGACANGACAGTSGAQTGGSLKPQVDSNFQGGSGTYDADPTTPAGTRRPSAPRTTDPPTDATFDAPATPRRSAPAGSNDDFNAPAATTEEITPFGAETGVSNKPPVPEIKDLDPVQPDATFAPEPSPNAPDAAQPGTDPAVPAADPSATAPAAEGTDSGDAFLPVEPTAPAPKPAAPEARRVLPGSALAIQGSRMHEVLRPGRLAQKPASGTSLTQKPVPDKVRWISAPLSEGHVRL